MSHPSALFSSKHASISPLYIRCCFPHSHLSPGICQRPQPQIKFAPLPPPVLLYPCCPSKVRSSSTQVVRLPCAYSALEKGDDSFAVGVFTLVPVRQQVCGLSRCFPATQRILPSPSIIARTRTRPLPPPRAPFDPGQRHEFQRIVQLELNVLVSFDGRNIELGSVLVNLMKGSRSREGKDLCGRMSWRGREGKAPGSMLLLLLSCSAPPAPFVTSASNGLRAVTSSSSLHLLPAVLKHAGRINPKQTLRLRGGDNNDCNEFGGYQVLNNEMRESFDTVMKRRFVFMQSFLIHGGWTT